MADQFVQANHPVDQIVSSPANRALTTALYFARALNIPASEVQHQEKIYHASVDDLLHVIQGLDDEHSAVMLFGHNPGFTYIVEKLTGEWLSMPTCAIAAIDVHVDTWEAAAALTGTLVFHDYPKKHLQS